MTDKTPTTLNLTEANIEYLDAETDNRSAFVNELLEAHREGIGDMLNQYRLDQLQVEKDTALSKAERIDDEMEAIRGQIESAEERREREFAETAEQMDGIPAAPDNAAVQTQAEKLDMDPAAFADRLRTWRQDDA